MPVSLDRIVNVTVTRSTRTASRRSFGIALIAAYHTAWLDRVRSYEEPDDMLDDGFTSSHPAYLAAVALCAQSPRVPSFKVGRRVGAPDQTIRLTPSSPVEGEVFSVTIGGVTFAITAGAGDTANDVVDDLVLRINADPDAIIASGVGSTAGIQTILPASFNGVIGDGDIAPPRNLTMTLNNHADWDATVAVVTGLDATGKTITENFSIPNGGNTVLVGTKVFSLVTQLAIPAQTGTNGTLLLGVGDLFSNANLDITATDGTTFVDVSADDVGAWFAYTGVTANLTLEDRTAEPGTTLATDLAAIQAADADWYGLIVADAQSDDQIAAIATWAESEVLVYGAHTLDSAVEADVDTDIASVLRAASRLRTLVFYSRENHGTYPDAALFGKMMPLDVGSVDAEFKELSGCSADDLSTTVVERLVGTPESPSSGKRATIYVEILPTGTNRGTSVTMGGLTSGGEWLDVVMGIDFMTALIQERIFNLRIGVSKLPFTEAGLDSVVGAVRSALRTCAALPYNFLDPATIVVEGTKLEDVDPADRQARHYDGVKFDARVQGALRSVRVRGTVRP